MSTLPGAAAPPDGLFTNSGQPTASRFASVDALRGLIMIVMAVDHASAFIARQHGIEFWAGAMSYYSDAFPFLTRWITHLCAPGFFFLMGAGVYWYAAARSGSAPGSWAPTPRIVWRGAVIVAIGQVLEAPIVFLQELLKPPAVSFAKITAPPPNDGSSLAWGFIVLTGLGMVLMVCGLLLRLRPWMWLAVAALSVVVTNTLLPATPNPGSWWMAMLLAPGIAQHIIAMYPLIPWLACGAAGMYFGYWWRQDPARAGRQVWLVGAALLVSGILLRAAGGWGNIRPPRDGGWIEFLNNVKYPPSLVFLLMAIGIDLLLLALLARLPAKWLTARTPWIVFGQTPLFFYIAHFVLLAAMGFAFFADAAPLQMAWAMWAVALALLYPVCLRYRDFKMGKPRESVWRML